MIQGNPAPRQARWSNGMGKMLGIVALACGVFLLLATVPATAARESVERIAAIVNKTVITESELDARTAIARENFVHQNIAVPEDSVLRHQVLERMVTETLQNEIAAQQGLKIDDVELERAIGKIADQNHMTEDQLKAEVGKEGLTFDRFREQIRAEILYQHLRERQADSRVNVTDAEVNDFIKQHPDNEPSEFHLQHILVEVPDGATDVQKQASQKKAEAALAAIKGGKDFAAVAAQYSEASDALEGGDLGWRTAARLPDLFVNAANALKAGDVSAILSGGNGFHIIKLLESKGTQTSNMVVRTHVRHILIKTNEVVSEEDARARLEPVAERLKHGENFADLARVYSEDTSASKGGDLGWINPGDTVPEFERAMDALQPGQISEPVRSPFGWHLIQVLERKTEDLGPERRRMQARMELRTRRGDELYEEWLRDLRNTAYVDVRE